MQTILPTSSVIFIAETNEEFDDILTRITGSYCETIEEIGYIYLNCHCLYIKERNNIIIVKYIGTIEEETEQIISDFYTANGYNW